MRPEVEAETNGKEALGLKITPDDEDDLEEGQDDSAIELRKQLEEEEELFRKVDVLERMRSRRELEDVIGIPFPVSAFTWTLIISVADSQNIPFPLHLLWRLDTLLLNLGLTLILSAFYFNPFPIYRHHLPVATAPREPSRFLWLVWALVALLHVAVSLTWKVVGRVGVGAVTWGVRHSYYWLELGLTARVLLCLLEVYLQVLGLGAGWSRGYRGTLSFVAFTSDENSARYH